MFLQKRAAGALVIARGFVLLQQRSLAEHEPLSWCNPGGMADEWETPMENCIRETHEESGIDLTDTQLTLLHTHVNDSGDFRYDTFLARIPEPVRPVNSPESVDSGWFQLGSTIETVFDYLPTPLHSGMTALIAARYVREALIREIGATTGENA